MKPLRHSLTRSFLLLGLSVAGCAPAATQVSSAAVEGAVGTLQETENLQRIDRITASPEFQNSLERVSGSLARGIAGEVDVDVEELGKAAEVVGRGLGRGLARGVRGGLGAMPTAGSIVDDTITGALTSVTAEQNRERARLLASEVTGTIVSTAIASMAQGIEHGLNPPISPGSSAAPPAAAAASERGLEHALGSMVREVSKQATLGFDAGMEEVRESNRAQKEGILGRSAAIGMWVAVGALGLLLVGAIVMIVLLGVANNRRRQERERMITTMWMAFASQGNGIDEATREELRRHLGITSPNFSMERKASS